MKEITIKKGNRLVIRIVPDDYKEEKKDVFCGDLTTGARKIIGGGYSKEDWNRIFKNDKK